MKRDKGSIHIGGKGEDQRPFSEVEKGETLTVRRLVHHWKNPEKGVPGEPHIDRLREELEAPSGYRFCVLFLGCHSVNKPFSEDEIEKRLNSLGWYRREH